MCPLPLGLFQGIICHIARLKGETWSPELLERPKQEGIWFERGTSDPSSYHVPGPLTWPTQANKFLPKNNSYTYTKINFFKHFWRLPERTGLLPKEKFLILTWKNNQLFKLKDFSHLPKIIKFFNRKKLLTLPLKIIFQTTNFIYLSGKLICNTCTKNLMSFV